MTKQNIALAQKHRVNCQVFIIIKKIKILPLASGEIGFDEKKMSKRQTTVLKLVTSDSSYEGGLLSGGPFNSWRFHKFSQRSGVVSAYSQSS